MSREGEPMARFEVVVQGVGAQAEGESVDTASAGIPLATILERTGGKDVWHVEPPQHLRDRWKSTSVAIGDANLGEIARATTIPVSLEHLRTKDPAATRVKIRFEVSYSSPAESRVVTALDEKPQLR